MPKSPSHSVYRAISAFKAAQCDLLVGYIQYPCRHEFNTLLDYSQGRKGERSHDEHQCPKCAEKGILHPVARLIMLVFHVSDLARMCAPKPMTASPPAGEVSTVLFGVLIGVGRLRVGGPCGRGPTTSPPLEAGHESQKPP
ncbi:hypothetical protein TruAng_007155 [Truncatella angustata]|nr:hypothetical protein TruAng_007155 [Truncatella angustata]